MNPPAKKHKPVLGRGREDHLLGTGLKVRLDLVAREWLRCLRLDGLELKVWVLVSPKGPST